MKSNDGKTSEVNISQKWTNAINRVKAPITRFLVGIAGHSARYPKTYVVSTILISLGLATAGLFTNFNLETNEDVIWTPSNSRAQSHGYWINNESGFDAEPRFFLLLIHREGSNVLELEGVKRTFEALDTIRETEGYDDLCKEFYGETPCPIYSPTKFWNDKAEEFEENISTDGEAFEALSASTFPNGEVVVQNQIIGSPTEDENGSLKGAESLRVTINLPPLPERSADFEEKALDKLFELRDAWTEDGSGYVVQFFCERSFPDEFERAIINDIPLVPAAFFIMSVFTCIIFWRRDWVNSRILLGFGAVTAILLALLSGYGIMFLIGVPFTSMTQILPFIMFGIGLDDSFIIIGEYYRTDKCKTPEQRVHDTIDEVGGSIFVTTATSTLAFGLGNLSSIPAIFWLCQYAVPVLIINLFFQLIFFTPLIIIDERRVADRRRDVLFWKAAPNLGNEDKAIDEVKVKPKKESTITESDSEPQEGVFDRFLGWYADLLCKPIVSIVIVVSFIALFGVFTFLATKLQQEFEFTDVMPEDSYASSYWIELREYGAGVTFSGIYFRYVDQCDKSIQDQMEEYVVGISNIKSVRSEPELFWLRDFKKFSNETESVHDLTCNEQIAEFLTVPSFKSMYEKDIVLDESGDIIASRTFVLMDQVDQTDVKEQIGALLDQREVSESEDVNKNREDYAFFSFHSLYYIWEFYAIAVNELLQSAIIGISTVTLIALIFIPHISATFFVFPLITVLYVDMLGVLQLAGIAINAVSYVALAMSIGLLVDFLMHILLRYYETESTVRKEKVKDTLKTMGASVLIGAVSTFFGVVPLAFSKSAIFSTIFVSFLGLVTLGAGHGLILLPALLNLFGPRVCTKEGTKKMNTTIENHPESYASDNSEKNKENTRREDIYLCDESNENQEASMDEMEFSC